MDGFVTDDAGGTGDEQIGPYGFVQYTGSRKDRAMPPKLPRIVIGAGLAWIFNHLRRLSGGQEINGYRAAGGRAQGAGGGHGAHGRLTRIAKSQLARRIEEAVAFVAVGLTVDF